MDISGKYEIGASREAVWQALNDPAVLQKCIPGCQSLEKVSDTELVAKVQAKIGPVKATFNATLELQDLNPPESYTLSGEGKSGAAGFGRGSARVNLTETEGGTSLAYDADFKVGGKLAQVGSRLVLGATRKMADDFFSTFSESLDPGAVRIDEEMPEASSTLNRKTWIATGLAVLLLLIWMLFLR